MRKKFHASHYFEGLQVKEKTPIPVNIIGEQLMIKSIQASHVIENVLDLFFE